MKKLGLIGLVLVTTVGCGRGWFPYRPFRGAPCNGPCISAGNHVSNHVGCDNCTGYSGYEGEQVVGDVNGTEYPASGYYENAVPSYNVAPPAGSQQPITAIPGTR